MVQPFAIDSITASVVQGALENIAVEMGYKLMRMSYSSIIRESEDFGAALVDADGRGLAESAQSTPLQSGPIPGYIRGILKTLRARGDGVRSANDRPLLPRQSARRHRDEGIGAGSSRPSLSGNRQSQGHRLLRHPTGQAMGPYGDLRRQLWGARRARRHGCGRHALRQYAQQPDRGHREPSAAPGRPLRVARKCEWGGRVGRASGAAASARCGSSRI